MKPFVFLCAFFWATVACAESPLLNHDHASHDHGASGREEKTAKNSGCDLKFPSAGLCAKVTWETGPRVGRESVLALRFTNLQTGEPADPRGPVSVELDMPSMGHGSAPTRIEKLITADGQDVTGAYRVTNVYFIMPGAWDVHVFLRSDANTGSGESAVLSLAL